MSRRGFVAATLLALLPATARADAFDYYTNPVLGKAVESGAIKETLELTPDGFPLYLGPSSPRMAGR